MIPTTTALTDEIYNDFDVLVEVLEPTKTYRMNLDTMRVQGHTDGQEAMKQAIYKILQTERYRYPEVYPSNNYGVEFWDLIGQPIPYVLPEIERRIREALTWDDRIESVVDFDFEVSKKKVHTTFYANTIFGKIQLEMAVDI